MKNKNQTKWIIAIVAILAVAYLAKNGNFNLQLPDFNFNLPGNTGGSGNNGQGGNNYYNYTQTPQSNSLVPTSLTVFVSPNPVKMGQYVVGSVISNGYNAPITIYAKLLGNGVTQNFGALLDAEGQFYIYQTLDTPGYWQFWAEAAGGVKSNVLSLTVTGIRITAARDTYSKSFSDSLSMEVFSNMHGNFAVIANDPAHSVSYPITNCVVNSNGYGTVAPSLDSLANGGYALDAVIGSEKASDYSATWWVTVGR